MAAVFGLVGVVAAIAAPVISVLPWIVALGAGVVGGYLWGSEGRALLPRRRR
jgi:hypothetical protein